MSKIIKVEVVVRTNKVGSDCKDILDLEVEGDETEEELEKMMEEISLEWMWEHLDFFYKEVK